MISKALSHQPPPRFSHSDDGVAPFQSDWNSRRPTAALVDAVGNSETVLIVDDDRDLVAAVRLQLQSAGFLTLCAYDGDEGIESAESIPPDAILLDVRMPRMNGLTALRILRSSPELLHVPVVISSATTIDRQTAFDAGAKGFLRKPLGRSELIHTIERVIHETN